MEDDFNIYVEKICRGYGLTREEALQDKLVQEVKLYYERMEGGLECEP